MDAWHLGKDPYGEHSPTIEPDNFAGSREKLPDREKFHKRFFEKFCWRIADGELRVDCGNLVLLGEGLRSGIMELTNDEHRKLW